MTTRNDTDDDRMGPVEVTTLGRDTRYGNGRDFAAENRVDRVAVTRMRRRARSRTDEQEAALRAEVRRNAEARTAERAAAALEAAGKPRVYVEPNPDGGLDRVRLAAPGAGWVNDWLDAIWAGEVNGESEHYLSHALESAQKRADRANLIHDHEGYAVASAEVVDAMIGLATRGRSVLSNWSTAMLAVNERFSYPPAWICLCTTWSNDVPADRDLERSSLAEHAVRHGGSWARL